MLDWMCLTVSSWVSSICQWQICCFLKHFTNFLVTVGNVTAWDGSPQSCLWLLSPSTNGRHFAGDILKCIFLNENVKISILFSLKFVPKGPVDNKSALVQANWAFPDCISSLKSPMAKKRCTKLEVALKRCPIVFQGHTSNFKVTRLKKASNLTQIGRFQTVTPVWIHWWIWNDTQSLM